MTGAANRVGPGGRAERMGWCYAHADGSGATSEGSGRVACQRGLHKDAALRELEPELYR